jgi:ComF family protein
MTSFWQTCKNSLCHLIYPSRCLHCREHLPPETTLLCNSCAELLELINPDERCQTCFIPSKNGSTDHCKNCHDNPSLFYQKAAVFDYIGPAATLVKKIKYANQPFLARGMGAFLAAQFDRLDWPLPDALVPVPISFSRWIERGYNQSLLMADEMAKFLNIPVWDLLKRQSGDFSQAGLNLDQRQRLEGQSFILRKSPLENQTLLLIDDVMTSGATLNKTAECLMEGNPSCLYALTFCQAIF